MREVPAGSDWQSMSGRASTGLLATSGTRSTETRSFAAEDNVAGRPHVNGRRATGEGALRTAQEAEDELSTAKRSLSKACCRSVMERSKSLGLKSAGRDAGRGEEKSQDGGRWEVQGKGRRRKQRMTRSGGHR